MIKDQLTISLAMDLIHSSLIYLHQELDGIDLDQGPAQYGMEEI